MKKQIITTLLILTVILAVIFYNEISQAIIILAYTVAGLLVFAFILIAIPVIWYITERMKLLRARRLEAEKRAHVMTVTVGNQVFVRDTDHKAAWHAMHLEARAHINSKYSEPSSPEIQRWQVFNAPPRTVSKPLELPPPQTQIDLLAALDNEQRVLIKGPSNAGKTNLLQWIAGRKLNNSQVLVIDPHASPNKWPGCQVVGEGSNHDEIEDMLTKLIGVMVQRYKEIAQGLVREGEHPKLTVIIDEWMSISYQCKNATDTVIRLLTESRKAAFSIFIGSHSERVKSLGLDGKGDLREGFVLVRLSIVNGQRQATIDLGNGEVPTTLPGAFVAGSSQVTNGDEFTSRGGHEPTLIESAGQMAIELKPSQKEQKILAMYRSNKSFRTISQEIWGEGKFGDFYNQKIQQVIEKYGEK